MNHKKDCLYFGGFKPCRPFKVCEGCNDYKKTTKKILYIHTGGLGDIVRQIPLLRQLLDNNVQGKIFIVTAEYAFLLFEGLVQLYTGQIVLYRSDDFQIFGDVIEFDELYNFDRDLKSCALATKIKAKNKKGFFLDKDGVINIMGETKASQYLYDLGLDDKEKFYNNKKNMTQIVGEAFGLWPIEVKNQKGLILSKELQKTINERKASLSKDQFLIMGINLGVGRALPTKALSERIHINIIKFILGVSDHINKKIKILLLGGSGEEVKADSIISFFSREKHEDVIISKQISVNLFEGIADLGALDLLVSGDTFALHMALGLNISHVVWFGPTHPEEISLSEKSFLVQYHQDCSPCWGAKCFRFEKCFDSDFIFNDISEQIKKYLLDNGLYIYNISKNHP